MSSVFESVVTGLSEAIEDAKSKENVLKRRTVVVMPIKKYEADQIREIRKSVNMSQSTFASYMGVSEKTVEAWEAGTNCPSGAASRLLNMMEMDTELTERFPFVKAIQNNN